MIGGALSPEPRGAPKLYITGSLSTEFLELVGSFCGAIDIVDNQRFSVSERQDRVDQVSDTLSEIGFQSFRVTSPLDGDGVIEANVALFDGAPSTDEIRAQLPAGTPRRCEALP